MSSKAKWAIGLVALIGGAAVYHYFFPGYCRSAKSRYGLELEKCPEGQLVQVVRVRAEGLSRTEGGTVRVAADAAYTISKADEERTSPIRSFDVALVLVAPDGTEQRLEPEAESEKDRDKGKKGGWRRNGNELVARISLPPVDDADYKLRARVRSRVGESTVDVALGLYAPARIHVLTDRPLYEPGNVVQFRSLSVRARDLTPIDRRPGTWIVSDPTGEVLLEEKVTGLEWGVASGTFPLDSGAASGQWTVSWRSGDDVGERSFTVEPFTLPRFRVEAATEAPFYGRRDRPVLAGTVTYSSGAPVLGARIDVQWTTRGAWPPPPAWMTSELPKTIDVQPNGRFRVDLPEVPADLQGQTTLVATLTATDPAGDRVVGVAPILLSEDKIAVEALTELAGGLVQGSNNRMFLRVTSADGKPLAGRTINVKRGWQPDDKGIDAELDADGVGRVQVDPGPPVNVVIPAMPARAQQPGTGPLVARIAARDLVSQTDATLADRRGMDGWTSALEGCAKWATGVAVATVGVRVAASGQIESTVAGPQEISTCAAQAIGRQRLSAGEPRMLSLQFRFADPRLPTLNVASTATLNTMGELSALFATAAIDARSCVDRSSPEELGDGIAWQLRAGDKKLTTSWIRVSSAPRIDAATKSCIMAAINRRTLDAPAASSDLGVVRFSVTVPAELRVPKPQPTIMKGYELRVTAELADGETGQSIVRLAPGAIPRIRIRATPVIASPGETVEIAVLRGPDYAEKLPKELRVRHLDKTELIELDEKDRVARFTIPADASGWYAFEGVEDAAARVYVKSGSELEVTVASAAPRYQPGQSARIEINTKVGGQGAAAAVGLFGVDSSLAQLATLAGPDELASLRVPIEMADGPAFGVLDAQALTVGRIRGANAAEATVLRVSRVPPPGALDNSVNAYGETELDAVAIMTDRFYPVLAELHAQARAWERTAAKESQADNRTIADLWKKALAAVSERGGSVTDAYGRKLRLHRLPGDLLALTEPRMVVVVGTRLPEDVENWANWVRKEKP